MGMKWKVTLKTPFSKNAGWWNQENTVRIQIQNWIVMFLHDERKETAHQSKEEKPR